ncbi:porin [Pseudomonas sp. ABC1]|uniref:porin n=1 Tax=Pseudomonas sp. ABC1 TaxID=2748080 RepID=UPI002119F14B|nr:porin [Pseudomonas sp. ABC1]
MADVSIYGRAHVSVDYLDDGAKYSETNLSSNSSRLGFKGDHEINPNLKAFFQIEQEIRFNSQGSSSDTFSTRDTFVGLSGNFGAVQVGRFDSPFKVARGPANLFGDQVGDIRNLTRAGDARFDERYDNTIQYTTPNFNGFTGNLAYSLHEGTTNSNAAANDDDSSVSASVNYVAGAFEGALAYEKVDEDASRGKRDGVRLALAYKLTKELKLVGFYQTVDYEGRNATKAVQDQNTANVYGLGGEFAVGPNTALKATWFTRDVDAKNYDSDMWVVGVEHKLDKAVRVYANYAVVSNDDNVNLTPYREGRSANRASGVDALGKDSSGLSVGLRYDF